MVDIIFAFDLILPGTIYRKEHCLDVNSFLGGGTKLLKIVHSDQMIALFDAEKHLEAELGKQ